MLIIKNSKVIAILGRYQSSNLLNNGIIRARMFSCSLNCLAEERAKYFQAKMNPMLPEGTFDGKVAFVTGGGTGLGRGIAQMLSSLGAKVAIVSRSLDTLEKTATEISSETKRKVLAFQCDVRNSSDVQAAVSNCINKLGLPSIIVNNAAGNFVSPTERLSSNAFKTVIDIVLNGTANITLDIAKRLIHAKQGASFVNISTVYTETGSAFVVPSAAAKAGIEALTKSLASEWGKYGMRFNCIQPGPFQTKGAFSRLDPTGSFAPKMATRISVGRTGEIGELANLACYLLSDYANWVTGSIIRMDGGELNYMGGEFNEFHSVSKEQWDMMETMIRKTKGS